MIHFIEIILLTIAISLDSFAIMTVEGASLPKINTKELIKVGALFGGSQTLALLLGNLLVTRLMNTAVISVNQTNVNNLLVLFAVFIFISLGAYMLWEGLKNENFFERRNMNLNINRVAVLALLTSIDGLLVGMGLSFLNATVVGIFLPILVINIIAVILGVHTGYWFGIEQKSKAYAVGGGILIIIGVQLLIEPLLIAF